MTLKNACPEEFSDWVADGDNSTPELGVEDRVTVPVGTPPPRVAFTVAVKVTTPTNEGPLQDGFCEETSVTVAGAVPVAAAGITSVPVARTARLRVANKRRRTTIGLRRTEAIKKLPSKATVYH